MSERRYDDKEVALILKRAAESRTPAAGEGLTLEQLQVVAVEAGIDPDAITRAASAIALSAGEHDGTAARGSAARHHERIVDVQVEQHHIPEVIAAIRRAMGRQGVVTTEFDGVQWRARDMSGGRYISIQPQGDRTIIRGLGNFRDGAAAIGMMSATAGAAVTVTVAKGIGLLAGLGLLSIPLVAVGAVVPAVLMIRRLFRREDALMRAAVDEAARALSSAGGGRPDRPALPSRTPPSPEG